MALCLPLQVKLSRLCEQDKILKDLEMRISSLKEDKVARRLKKQSQHNSFGVHEATR